MTGKANTIFAFGNSRQSVLDLHYFVRVPVREIIEQMDSAFVRRAIEPLLIVLDGPLFRLQMFASLNNFVTPSSQSLIKRRIVNSIHCVSSLKRSAPVLVRRDNSDCEQAKSLFVLFFPLFRFHCTVVRRRGKVF
jgi:hypothetical protein